MLTLHPFEVTGGWLTHVFLQFVPPPPWVPHPCDFFFRKGGFGKGFLLAGVPSGSWNYNSDDELSSETYDKNGNVTAANGQVARSYPPRIDMSTRDCAPFIALFAMSGPHRQAAGCPRSRFETGDATTGG